MNKYYKIIIPTVLAGTSLIACGKTNSNFNKYYQSSFEQNIQSGNKKIIDDQIQALNKSTEIYNKMAKDQQAKNKSKYQEQIKNVMISITKPTIKVDNLLTSNDARINEDYIHNIYSITNQQIKQIHCLTKQEQEILKNKSQISLNEQIKELRDKSFRQKCINQYTQEDGSYNNPNVIGYSILYSE